MICKINMRTYSTNKYVLNCKYKVRMKAWNDCASIEMWGTNERLENGTHYFNDETFND